MPATAVTLPAWVQITLAVVAILSSLGAAWFALFIIWPSIRRQTRLGDRINELIDKAHKKLDGVQGKQISVSDFLDSTSSKGSGANQL